VVRTNEPFSVRLDLDLARVEPALTVGFDLTTSDGVVVMRSYHTDGPPERWPQLHAGRNTLVCTLPAGLLNDGRYLVMPRVSIYCVRWIVHVDSGVSFEVHRDPGPSPYAVGSRPGAIAPVLEWQTGEPDW
jgi:lipopolysaccharide transport system ATP-binding protein